MSMFSEQVNKLRMLADKLRNVHARQGDDYVESCETLYWSMCAMLDAADTILSLQDRLQDAELGSSTLTAEQVHDAIERHITFYEGGDYDEQAITDELNAELGSGNADTDDALALLDEIREAGRISYDDYSQLFDAIAELGSGTCENKAKSWGEFECSECGFYADFGSDLHRVNRCPDCGKTVSA